jgi:hypothetical protein
MAKKTTLTPIEGGIQARAGSTIVTIPGIKTEKVTALIIGTAPLITHKFSEKMQAAILAKHTGEASAGREKKDPHANFEAARYRTADGGDGVPAGGVKAALVEACDKSTGLAASKAKGVFRVAPDCPATNLVKIISPNEPRMREDVVRNATGVVDIRHRPEYWPWAMLINVEFMPTFASMRQVLQAIEAAGFRIGLCEWRPASKMSKSGSYGTWRLATMEEIEAFEDGRLFGDPAAMAAE